MRTSNAYSSPTCLHRLAGSARVDLRVDRAGKPWILEVNPNPSIAPFCGLTAAAERAGLSYEQLIDTVLHSALNS